MWDPKPACPLDVAEFISSFINDDVFRIFQSHAIVVSSFYHLFSSLIHLRERKVRSGAIWRGICSIFASISVWGILTFWCRRGADIEGKKIWVLVYFLDSG
ncbi:hypothetical protein NE237_011428 [Protea cynaroides]|uniref:Uncharacterized protein n=1 Tax=Protea cynaroides TaxID=273540 RepID=A0A9Q0GW42_9MAGN|nr:hypothetical protein NE237_011428 [Protea cynaroides]